MTDFEKKMHHDGRLYGWAMLIAICAFPFFASVRSGIWPDFKIIWPGVLTMWILMASYFVREEKTGRVAINNISCLFYKILEI